MTHDVFPNILFSFHLILAHGRNNERLAKSARIDFQRRKLHIKNATAKDNGVYGCAVLHRGQSSGLPQEPVPSVKNYRLKLKATGSNGKLPGMGNVSYVRYDAINILYDVVF